ncbi:MAG TPA: hypothetical protein VNN19_08705 [bacterium]|nr:hypothetical protein [bacterium]
MRPLRPIPALVAAAMLLVPAASLAWAALPLRIVALTSPVPRGGAARVEAHTAPGAVCDIEVVYPSGRSRAAPLRPRRADGQGRVVWVWRVGRQVAPGKALVTVECLLGEDITRARAAFTVR